MSVLFLFLQSLLVFHLVQAQCTYSGIGSAPVTDLRTATPYTYVYSLGVYDCQDDPVTVDGWYTAYANGTAYPGANTFTYIFTGLTSTMYVSYTFPGLIVTNLVPGEEILLPYTNYFPTGTGTYMYATDSVTVAFDALTVPTTAQTGYSITTNFYPTSTANGATSTSTNTSNASSTTSSGSSTPVGAIAGGVIGGVIVIALIFAFAWYKIRTHKQSPPENFERYDGPPGPSPAPYYPQSEPEPEPQYGTGKSINNAAESAIRNMEETGPVSGNLRNNY